MTILCSADVPVGRLLRVVGLVGATTISLALLPRRSEAAAARLPPVLDALRRALDARPGVTLRLRFNGSLFETAADFAEHAHGPLRRLPAATAPRAGQC